MFSLGAMGVEEEQAQEWGERKEKEFLFGHAELGGTEGSTGYVGLMFKNKVRGYRFRDISLKSMKVLVTQ